jgi:antirestriction protein ArdC
MNSLVAKVIDQLIDEIENGTGEWRQQWRVSGMPINATTKNHYRGSNVLSLWIAGMQAGYTACEWATYKQWGGAGHYVRKGEKGTPILYFRKLEKEQDGNVRQIPMMRVSWVFNAAQVEGYQPVEKPAITHEQRHLLAGAWWSTLKIATERGIPQYGPKRDVIMMPAAEDFESLDAYWLTKLHETSHWSGHPSRLNRTLCCDMNSVDYALEELVAEMTGAMIAAHFGIDSTTRNTGAYLRSWLGRCKDKRAALMSAAKQASEAFTFLNPTFEEHRQQEAA